MHHRFLTTRSKGFSMLLTQISCAKYTRKITNKLASLSRWRCAWLSQIENISKLNYIFQHS